MRRLQAPFIPADWTGLMVEFRWSVDRIRLIQAPFIPADWTGLVVDVPKECGQDEANTGALYTCRLDRSYG
jgi:hypothetical protein